MPSPRTIRLTTRQRQQLHEARDAGETRTWCRAAALLLLDAGVAEPAIRTSLGVSPTTLLNWKRRWAEEGIGMLADRPRSGRPRRADTSYVQALLEAVQQDPRELGFAFTRWTAPRLDAYLKQRTGVSVSDRWLRELLRRHHFVWRKTKRTIRNLQDPVAVAAAQKKLNRLKKRPSEGGVESSGSLTASTSPCSR
jgi:transposase